MWEKLLLAISLTLTLQLCTQTGLFSFSQTTQLSIQQGNIWFVAHQHHK